MGVGRESPSGAGGEVGGDERAGGSVVGAQEWSASLLRER